MRAEPDKLEARVVRLAVDQDEVGPDVAITVIAPLAARPADDRNSGAVTARPSPAWLRFRAAPHRGACRAVQISRAFSRAESGSCT